MEDFSKQIVIDGVVTSYIIYYYSGKVINTKNGRELTVYPIDKNHRYCRVKFFINGKPRTVQYHRLKMMVFYPVENMDKLQVNHIDGDRNNNDFSNLEWVTPSENSIYAIKTGLKKPIKGEDATWSVLTKEKVVEICKMLEAGETTTKIAECFNISRSNIQAIRLKIEWKDIVCNYNFPKKNGNHKITEDVAISICDDIVIGILDKEIAEKYNLSPSYIKNMRLKKTWKCITENYDF